MRSIDFVIPYTQADVKTDIFMQQPAGTTIKGVDPNKHLLKLQMNLYGLKDGQVTGMSTSRPVSSHEDSNNPRLTLVSLSRGPSFLSSTSTTPPYFPPIPWQSTMRSCPSSHHSNSPMKENFKTTWGPGQPSTQTVELSFNKRR